jgi:hypothetical protein
MTPLLDVRRVSGGLVERNGRLPDILWQALGRNSGGEGDNPPFGGIVDFFSSHRSVSAYVIRAVAKTLRGAQ